LNSYRIFETNEFIKSLKGLEAVSRRLVEEKLKRKTYPQLREQPFYGPNIRKLRDYKPETWRYLIGTYRLFYAAEEHDRIVPMLTIDDRKDRYR
jgi:mRNA interferase RelE/StbE